MKFDFRKERRSVTGFPLSHDNGCRAQIRCGHHDLARVLSRRNVGAPLQQVRLPSGAATSACNLQPGAARTFLSGENRCGRGRPHSTL